MMIKYIIIGFNKTNFKVINMSIKKYSTYLTTDQLSDRIHYTARTIRNELLDACLIEGTHYIRPFGRRKILFIWEAIESDMLSIAHDSLALAYEDQKEIANHG
jgi:hypothetical protein